jgi:TetR/AcrR family transcriptional repressor of nem operon
MLVPASAAVIDHHWNLSMRPFCVALSSPPNRRKAKAEQLARDPLQQLLVFVGLFIELTDKLQEPFAGCLYASYCYQSGAISAGIMSKINQMMHFWRQRLCEKIDAIVAINPPRFPIENHRVADHLLTTFEGAFIKVMKEPRLASQQLIQCRNYIELLFTPVL